MIILLYISLFLFVIGIILDIDVDKTEDGDILLWYGHPKRKFIKLNKLF